MRTTTKLLQIKSSKMPPLLLFCAAVLVLGSSAERYMPAAGDRINYGRPAVKQACCFDETPAVGDGIDYGRAMVKQACCAEITGSVIQPLPGNRGNVALILDKGPDPLHPNGRVCTNADKDFV